MTQAEIEHEALAILMRYAIGNGSSREGNPYSKPEVMYACHALYTSRDSEFDDCALNYRTVERAIVAGANVPYLRSVKSNGGIVLAIECPACDNRGPIEVVERGCADLYCKCGSFHVGGIVK